MARKGTEILVVGVVAFSLVASLLTGLTMAPSPQPGVDSGTPYFDPPHTYQTLDTNLDGLYDQFRTNARVSLASAVPTTVYIREYVFQLITTSHPSDPNQTTASLKRGPTLEITVTISPGTATYSLTDSSRLMYDSKYNGTWGIWLVMTDAATGALYGTDTLTTSSLSWTSFNPSEARLVGPLSDYAQDINGDGMKDFLRVNVTFIASASGTYGVVGYLYTNDWTTMFSSTSIGPSSYVAGTYTVQLSFDVTCCQSYLGPYRVGIRVTDSTPTSSAIIYDETTYTTSTTSFVG